MTTSPEPPVVPETPVAPPEETDEGDRSDAPEGGTHSREAANYRRRLREVEAERDGLQGRIDTLERAEVERIAREHPLYMVNPSDLWTIGTTLDELRGEDGHLDQRVIATKVREVCEARPTWRREVDLGQGARGSIVVEPKPAGLSQLLKGKR
jgi:hypothetical protein